MYYETWIVDECGDLLYRCMDLRDSEIEEILIAHPEWRKRTIQA